MKAIQMAVTEFAVPSPRCGSIAPNSGYGPLPNVGSLIHLDIQAERARENPGYVSERWISHSFEHEKLKVTVNGRVDGFLFGYPARIEEIKSSYGIESLRETLQAEADHPYKRQLRTYGYIHYLQHGHVPDLALILACARTRKTEVYPVELDPEEYQQWLVRRMSEIQIEQKAFEKLHARRKSEAAKFVFPFDHPRQGQKELIEDVEKNLGKNRQLLLQAPTGLGKTIGIMYPTLREAYMRGQKLIYLTAKNTQHEVAEDAAKRLQGTGLKLRALTIHAKTKMCLKDEPQCNPEVCEFARDYYSKLAQHGLAEKLHKKKNLSATAFKKLGREYEVCPFELQLEAVGRADVIIGDYNYVFSPHHSRGRLVQNGYGFKGAPNLVIDEAHNLPARANDYFSAKLDQFEIGALLSECETVAGELWPQINDVRLALITLFGKYKQPQPSRIELDPQDFVESHTRASLLLAAYLAQGSTLKHKDPIIRLVNLVTEFALRVNEKDDTFISTWVPSGNEGSLRLTCCDASRWLNKSYEEFENVVAFSATLKPFEYYSQLLGFDSDRIVTAEFSSPFPIEQRKLLIIPQISTKSRDRAANYSRIAETIARIVQVRKGNYFAFFPSFEFMNQVAQRTEVDGYTKLIQSREMNRRAVEQILDEMRSNQNPMLIFAVQGSVFAEGVDYPGDMLIGAFIVGPALPNFDFEREQLRDFYEKKYGQGFDYAYTYPAMARVIQSAGRVIRSHDDRGLIVLMDRRFLDESYSKSMPSDWCPTGPAELVSTSILSDVQRFWDQHGF